MTAAEAARLVAVGVVLAVSLPVGWSFAAGAQESAARQARQRLKSLVEELTEKRGELREVMRDERRATALLSELDEARYKARRELRAIERKIAPLEARVLELRAKVHVDVESVAALEQRVRARLRALARVGGYSHLRVLLSARSLHDLALRRALLRRIALHDAALLKALRDGEAELAGDRKVLEDELAELQQSRQLAARTLEELEKSRAARAEALLELGSSRGALEARIEQLRQSQSHLRTLIWQKTVQTREAVGLATLKGQLPWPCRARRDTKAENSTATGWVLRPALGTKVHAVAPGKVVHAGFLRGYGLLVILDHGHGYHSLYAHLARASVEVGAQVSQADVLGYSGDSESFDGPRLYFELRMGGRPVDVGRWLRPQP